MLGRLRTALGSGDGSGSGFGRPQAHAQFKLGSQAQGHRAFRAPRTTRSLDSKASDFASRKTTADYIVAVINQEVVTRTDVDRRIARIVQSAQGQNLPPMPELRKAVLDLLIDEKVQVNQAKVLGMDVSDAEVDGTIEEHCRAKPDDRAANARTHAKRRHGLWALSQ